ncbi:hypothetical protein BT96DRAFT_1009211 [Gymnopus androsaceus JB14]|uniref:Uncharacterized protein n=1 Tax=Gymnopus androsaceus JB14 TaxID=1447944 RepID=A0A6A4GD00_9AGAR|nr:hypothetical protein BT96DRAFT_1009211 [Gymnopus androsaceus JB14]
MSLAIVNNAHTNGNPVPDATNSTGSQTGNAKNNPASMNIEETGIHGTPRHGNKSHRKTRNSSAHIDPVDGDGLPSRDRHHSSISHANYDSSDLENSGEGGTHMMRNRTVLPLHNSGNDDENLFIDRPTQINAASQQFIIRQPRLFATHPPETSSGGRANEHGSAHPAGQLNERLSGLNLSQEQLNAVLAALAPAPSSNIPPLSINSQDRARLATPTQEQSWLTYAMQILCPTTRLREKPNGFLPEHLGTPDWVLDLIDAKVTPNTGLFPHCPPLLIHPSPPSFDKDRSTMIIRFMTYTSKQQITILFCHSHAPCPRTLTNPNSISVKRLKWMGASLRAQVVVQSPLAGSPSKPTPVSAIDPGITQKWARYLFRFACRLCGVTPSTSPLIAASAISTVPYSSFSSSASSRSGEPIIDSPSYQRLGEGSRIGAGWPMPRTAQRGIDDPQSQTGRDPTSNRRPFPNDQGESSQQNEQEQPPPEATQGTQIPDASDNENPPPEPRSSGNEAR